MHYYRYIRLIRSKCKRSNVINRNIVSRYVIVNTRPDIYYKDSKVYPISHWIGTSESALFEQSLHDIRRVYRFRKRILVRVSTIRCIHIGEGWRRRRRDRHLWIWFIARTHSGCIRELYWKRDWNMEWRVRNVWKAWNYWVGIYINVDTRVWKDDTELFNLIAGGLSVTLLAKKF